MDGADGGGKGCWSVECSWMPVVRIRPPEGWRCRFGSAGKTRNFRGSRVGPRTNFMPIIGADQGTTRRFYIQAIMQHLRTNDTIDCIFMRRARRSRYGRDVRINI